MSLWRFKNISILGCIFLSPLSETQFAFPPFPVMCSFFPSFSISLSFHLLSHSIALRKQRKRDGEGEKEMENRPGHEEDTDTQRMK